MVRDSELEHGDTVVGLGPGATTGEGLAVDAKTGSNSRVPALEAEVRAGRRRLAAREKALSVLNRRLVQL